jgi:large repetitive protein
VLNEAGVNGIVDVPVSFANAANGNYRMSLTATDRAGNSTEQIINFTLNLPPPSVAPVILFPVAGTQLSQPSSAISGTATPDTLVQIFVNDVAVPGLAGVSPNGSFASFITGLAEGGSVISAESRNIRGASPRSAPVSVTFTASPPTLVFSSPGNGATVTADTLIELVASANAPRSISNVVLSINGSAVPTLTNAPYRFNWDVSSVANGVHTLSAIATDSSGATTTSTISVTLNKPPPPVITPYIGRVDSVSPNASFGNTPVSVQGQAVGRFDNVPVGGAPLLLKLNNNGFVRTINVVTNASGAFSFNFVPQPTDSGTYQVNLIHPDENTPPVVQGSFAVDRLSVNNSRIRLRAARGFTERFTVYLSASAGASATNVSLTTPASAQPSGVLPVGIGATATPVSVSAAEGAVPYEIAFTSTAQSPNTGVLVAQLFANESGSTMRAEIRIDFELIAAEPVIVPTPTALSLGAKRGQSVSERILLQNNGLVAANGVTATLLTLDDAPPPSWVFQSSAPAIGAINAGASNEVQINAAPNVNVDDGVYQFKLRVRRDVAGVATLVGDLPISVAVTSSDNGKVSFETADIYTNTRDAQNNLIQGVADTRISLTNEAVPTQVFNVTTGSDGTALTADIPAGRYRWRASASNHKDASGIVVVRPGGATQQKIFLEYTVVSFNFSVTETTIQDQYDIVITATFQTQVPAPVVIIEPSAINVPPMQVGEQISGEITITNYGLIRAENVVFTPPQSNEYWNIEIGGTVPPSLDAKQRIVLPYKLTLIAQTPGGNAPPPQLKSAAKGSLIQKAMANGMMATMSRDTALAGLKRATQKSGATCSSIQASGGLAYEFECANGDKSGGSGGFAFASTIGGGCGASGVGAPSNPVCTTSSCGNGGGWGGGGGGGAPLAPGCTPDCPKGTCCNGGGAGGG